MNGGRAHGRPAPSKKNKRMQEGKKSRHSKTARHLKAHTLKIREDNTREREYLRRFRARASACVAGVELLAFISTTAESKKRER